MQHGYPRDSRFPHAPNTSLEERVPGGALSGHYLVRHHCYGGQGVLVGHPLCTVYTSGGDTGCQDSVINQRFQKTDYQR